MLVDVAASFKQMEVALAALDEMAASFKQMEVALAALDEMAASIKQLETTIAVQVAAFAGIDTELASLPGAIDAMDFSEALAVSRLLDEVDRAYGRAEVAARERDAWVARMRRRYEGAPSRLAGARTSDPIAPGPPQLDQVVTELQLTGPPCPSWLHFAARRLAT